MTSALTRSEKFDASLSMVREALSEAAAQHKAQKPDPYADEYIYWRKDQLVCVLVVKHQDKPNSFEVSRDGGPHRHLYLPLSCITALSESDDDFLMALVSRRWVKRIEARDFIGGSRLRELFGVVLPLSAERQWTEEQCVTWHRLSARRASINTRIQCAKPRSISNISRGDAA